MRLSDYVIDRLANEDVKHIFSVSGRGSLFLTDSVAKDSRISYVGTHHEQAAGFAAMAYSQFTQNISACILSTGAGSTNALTPLLCAWQDAVPCIFISGQHNLQETTYFTKQNIRTYGQQETNIIDLVRPITKYSVMVTNPEDIGKILDDAIFFALEGRKGPVWIDIPLDLQSAQVDISTLRRSKNKFMPKVPNPKELTLVLEALSNASRPIILYGHGVKASNSQSYLKEFMSKWKIPAVYTGSSADTLDGSDSLVIGSVGIMGCSRAGNFSIQNSDLVIILGHRLSSMTTGTDVDLFARSAKKIMIDIDEFEYRKNVDLIDIFINSDVNLFLKELLEYSLINDFSDWAKKCFGWKNLFSVREREFSRKTKVDLYQLADLLSSKTKPDTIFVTDSGLIELIIPTNLIFSQGKKIIHPVSQGAMGYALPASIGANLASMQEIIVISGDGSTMMNLQELQTIVTYNLPIKIFVINNDGYAIIRKRQSELFRGRTIGTDKADGVECAEYSKVAKAFGIDYFLIQNYLDLEINIDEILQNPGPYICEIIGFPDQEYIRLARGRNSNNKLVKKPLEDLWPFIPREIFKKEMVVPQID